MEIQDVQYNLGQLVPLHLQGNRLADRLTPSHVEVTFRYKQPIQPLADDLIAALERYFPCGNLTSKFEPRDEDYPDYHALCPTENYGGPSHGLAQIIAGEQDSIARIHLWNQLGDTTRQENFLRQYANRLKESTRKKQ